ncbi:MAG: hypothetical protein K5924_03250 [Chloroflexi bacterium]|nr:hypothetical protein [Chloroflexota bacterium]
MTVDAQPTSSTARAATTTFAAAVTLLLSGIALALFFGPLGGIFGPINDILLGLTFILLIPAVLEVRRRAASVAGAWFSWLALLAIGGIAVLVVGQVLLVTGLIPLGVSFATLGFGVLPFMLWAAALAVLSLRGRLLEPPVGWWGVAFAAALALAAATWPLLPIGVWSVFGVALLGSFLGWIVALGRALA